MDEVDLASRSFAILGAGVAGFGATAGLLGSSRILGHVHLLDESARALTSERMTILQELGAHVHLGADTELPAGVDTVVVSPGVPLNHRWIAQARDRGLDVWGELELAWRARILGGSAQAPWLVITGTNGKTTTTMMADAIMKAAGWRSMAVGNIGQSIVDAVAGPEVNDVFVVEASAQQLALVSTMSPYASVVLNFAPDHLDFFPNLADYRHAKAQAYERTQVAALWNDMDPETLHMLESADVVEGCRAIGFTLAVPMRSMLGVSDDLVIDRAFLEERGTHAIELCEVSDIQPLAAHNVLNALAAAGLARSLDVHPSAVKQGLKDFRPAPHRIAKVADINGIVFIDDSKATNEHAAAMSLASYTSVVWVAGGLAKGQDFGPLVKRVGQNIKTAILLGAERDQIAAALRQHAPHVIIVDIAEAAPDEVMSAVVHEALKCSAPGDTVLLAPGCSSWDIFPGGYAQRGEAFTSAVLRAAGPGGGAE